jgi:hypothetical protein
MMTSQLHSYMDGCETVKDELGEKMWRISIDYLSIRSEENEDNLRAADRHPKRDLLFLHRST